MNSCNSVLDYYANLAPAISQLITEDVSVAVTDAKKKIFLSYIPGEKVDHGVRKGDEVPEFAVAYKATQQDERLIEKAGRGLSVV